MPAMQKVNADDVAGDVGYSEQWRNLCESGLFIKPKELDIERYWSNVKFRHVL
jgi:hypothetical protein